MGGGDLPGLDDEALQRHFEERGQSLDEFFGPLVDPSVDADEAARRARIIAIATSDQGCCGPETPPAIRALVAVLQHPDCRAPATILRVLGNYLFDNAGQSDDEGPSDELHEGFDERTERWAEFRAGARFSFLHEMLVALNEGVPVYLAMLQHDDPGVREAAAYALAPRFADRDVGAELEERLVTEGDPHALAAAILSYSLQRKYEGGDVDPVERFLTDERLLVRVAAAIALANHDAESDAVLRVLEEGSRAAELVFGKSARRVSLGNGNLRLGATRALARSSGRFEALVDDTIVAHDTFVDSTVARVVAEELVWSIVLPKPLSSAEGEAREILEAIAQHPGAFSQDLSHRLGGSLNLSRELGLRPPSQLVGELAEHAAEWIVGSDDLTDAANEIGADLDDDDLLDLVEDLLGHSFRSEHLAFDWPDERPEEVIHKLRAEGDRRDDRAMLLAFRLLERGELARPVLQHRATAATGDRLGNQRAHTAWVLALLALDAPTPERCERVLQHAARVPELVPHARTFLMRLRPEARIGALTGWREPATCFYGDLLDAEGLVKLAEFHDYRLDSSHALPFLEKLADDNPELYVTVIDALVKRQGDGQRLSQEPGAVRRTLHRADGTSVELWGRPTPEPVNRLGAQWP